MSRNWFYVVVDWMNIHVLKISREEQENLPITTEYENPQEQPEISVNCDMPKELQETEEESKKEDWNFLQEESSVSGTIETECQDLKDVEAAYQASNNEKILKVKEAATLPEEANTISEGEETVSTDQETSHEEPTISSLLDNKPLVKLFSECADVLTELNGFSKDFKSEREQFLLEMVRDKIVSALLLSGGKAIDNDTSYDILRHVALNQSDAKDGAEIEEIVSPGVMLEDRVFIRAIVNLK